jgi:hypothetical protein
MKTKPYLGVVVGIILAGSIGVIAQISGGGVEGGGGQPAGNSFATQYKNGNRFGGTGPGTLGHVLTSNGNGMAPTFQAAAGGSVTSVGLTMPTGFSVAGSPVTSTGTLAVTTTLNGVVKGDGSALSASAVNLASADVTGILPIANGGTGSATGIESGTFTATFQDGFTADVTQDFAWTRVGTIVVLTNTSNLTGTSDATTIQTTGAPVPASIRPARITTVGRAIQAVNNGAGTPACIILGTTGQITYSLQTSTTGGCSSVGWTNTGTKSVSGGANHSFTYATN